MDITLQEQGTQEEQDTAEGIKRIVIAWDAEDRSREGYIGAIVATGAALIAEKDRVGFGNFTGMVLKKLPPRCGEVMARRRMAIADTPDLANQSNWIVLPVAVSTLYQLSRVDELCGPGTLSKWLAEGKIDPEVTAAEVEEWINTELGFAEQESEFARREDLPPAAVPADDVARAVIAAKSTVYEAGQRPDWESPAYKKDTILNVATMAEDLIDAIGKVQDFVDEVVVRDERIKLVNTLRALNQIIERIVPAQGAVEVVLP